MLIIKLLFFSKVIVERISFLEKPLSQREEGLEATERHKEAGGLHRGHMPTPSLPTFQFSYMEDKSQQTPFSY